MKTCSACGREYDDDVRFCQNDGTTLRAAASEEIIGSVIADRYHITKKLGEGGMGAVYLGEHVKMGRKSAIKVITQSMSSDAEAIARFNREAANAAQINHPNVCGIYDFGETSEGLIYLAMEFIEGEALTALLEREGALSPKRAGSILRQAAEALQAAHDLGIVHRDLKPDNIMIARERDGSDLVKVVDFGIAKAMGGESEQKVTKTGLVVGTPEYMSPEQLSGDQLNGKSDTYSLGLVFFRMLTGILPFQAESSQEIMIKRLTDDPIRLIDALPNANFPAPLQAAIDRALQRMPADRYEKASQFGHDVSVAVGELTDVAPKFDTSAATQVFQTDPEGATAQLPKTVIHAGADPASTGQRTATPPTPMPRPSPPKKKPVGAIAAAVAVVVVGGAGSIFVLGNRGDEPEPVNRTAVTPADTTALAESSTPTELSQTTNGQSDNRETNNPDPPPGDNVDTGNTDPTRRNDPPPVIVPPSIRVDVANASDQLFDLFDRITAGNASSVTLFAASDTALAYFESNAVITSDRALAAYVIANAHVEMRDRSQALTWARRAVQLEPNNASYQAMVRAQGGGAQ